MDLYHCMLVPLHPWMLASVKEFYNDGLYTTNNRAMHALSDAGDMHSMRLS